MKRVLQICPHDSAPFAVLCENIVHAAALVDTQVSSVFLAPASGEPLAYAEYLNVSDLSDSKQLRTRLLAFTEQSLATQQWDLVICHRYRSYHLATACGLANEKCIVLAHEYGLLDRWQRRLHRRLFASRCQFAGVAPEIAAQLAAFTGEAKVLPNSLDIDKVQSALLSRSQAQQELGLASGVFTVGVVGRLHYKKRPQLALSAFRSFNEQHPDSRVVFLGDGDARGELEGQHPCAHVLGNVANAARLFKAFDVLLHTADAEPFGMVVLEAMLAGVPVVCLPTHGPKYVLDELGVYALDDSAKGFTEALVRSMDIDRAHYAASALARARKHFSLQALAELIGGLVDEVR